MPIDPTSSLRSQGMLRDVSLFPFDSPEKMPACIAQKMLHQSEQSGAKRVIAANQLDPTKKRHLEETAGSTFHKKMRKEEEPSSQEKFADPYWREMAESQREPVKPRSKPKPARKKREVVRYLKPVFSGWAPEFPLNRCERARRAFYKTLMFESVIEGNKKCFTRDVYVIASGLFDAQKKRFLKIQAFFWVRKRYPIACVHFNWVDIPYGAFYALDNFQKMEDALYDIPLNSKIFIHEGRRLVRGKRQKEWAVKKPRKPLADKVIVFDPEGSSVICNLFKNSQSRAPHIAHYYITTGSSLEPFNRLTERSTVYFANRDVLIEQTPKMLTARGFRVIHSFKNRCI